MSNHPAGLPLVSRPGYSLGLEHFPSWPSFSKPSPCKVSFTLHPTHPAKSPLDMTSSRKPPLPAKSGLRGPTKSSHNHLFFLHSDTYTLLQGFSAGMILLPGDIWRYLQTLLVVKTVYERGCYCHLMLLSNLQCIGPSSQQTTVQPEMSLALRVRDPALVWLLTRLPFSQWWSHSYPQ